METEKSCGGIVFAKSEKSIQFLLVQSKRNGHWFFPKGHVENNESEEQTARREIYEEVWLEVVFLPEFRETFSYIDHTKNVHKTVVFFLCEAIPWVLTISDELQDCAWLDYDHAIKQLIHNNAKTTLTKAHDFLVV